MTIAEYMRVVLLETDNAAVMWGDVHLLDEWMESAEIPSHYWTMRLLSEVKAS